MKINIGCYVLLHKSALTYGDTDDFVKGFKQYYNIPVKVTGNVNLKEEIPADWQIENRFGVRENDIKMVISEEEYPEYFI